MAVKAGTEIYARTLEYTVGAEDPLADRTVVMTIDSVDYVVNNNVITGDAAHMLMITGEPWFLSVHC